MNDSVVSFILVCTAALASPSTGQSTLASHTQLFASATGSAGQRQQVFPPNTAITRPITLAASAGACSGWAQGHASFSVTPGPFTLQCVSGSDSSSTFLCPSVTARSGGSVNWTLTGNVQGTLIVQSWVSERRSTGNPYSVDIGADGSIEFGGTTAPSGRREEIFPVQGMNGVPIRVGLATVASAREIASASSSINLNLQFVPRGVALIRTVGDPCGAELTGRDQPAGSAHFLDFDVTGGFPSQSVAYLFGPHHRNPVTFPGTTNCLLFVNITNWVVVRANASGSARFSIQLPRPLPPISVQVQAAALDFGRAVPVRATNALSVTFQD